LPSASAKGGKREHGIDERHDDDEDEEASNRKKLARMSEACRTILECVGEDPGREGLAKTPERWAKALLFMTNGYALTPRQVTNGAVFEENHDEMVVVKNIDIYSLCEHHMVRSFIFAYSGAVRCPPSPLRDGASRTTSGVAACLTPRFVPLLLTAFFTNRCRSRVACTSATFRTGRSWG
jgi:hypothetical protein